MRLLALITAVCACTLLSSQAFAMQKACQVKTKSYDSIIRANGGRHTAELIKIYKAEGASCYIGDHGSSFGPFQMHFNGVADMFRKQTGLNIRNPSTVGAQIAFMQRWGNTHGGYSSNIWHGLRGNHRIAHRRYRWSPNRYAQTGN